MSQAKWILDYSPTRKLFQLFDESSKKEENYFFTGMENVMTDQTIEQEIWAWKGATDCRDAAKFSNPGGQAVMRWV